MLRDWRVGDPSGSPQHDHPTTALRHKDAERSCGAEPQGRRELDVCDEIAWLLPCEETVQAAPKTRADVFPQCLGVKSGPMRKSKTHDAGQIGHKSKKLFAAELQHAILRCLSRTFIRAKRQIDEATGRIVLKAGDPQAATVTDRHDMLSQIQVGMDTRSTSMGTMTVAR